MNHLEVRSLIERKLARRKQLNEPAVMKQRVKMTPPTTTISLTFSEAEEILRLLRAWETESVADRLDLPRRPTGDS